MVADRRPSARAELLQKTADAIKARFDDLLPLVIAETGCTATVGKQMQVPHARGALRDVRAATRSSRT